MDRFFVTDNTTIDDVIEHILKRLNTDFRGYVLRVADFCSKAGEFEFDPILEGRVRHKMHEHSITTRPPKYNDTYVELTPKGADIYEQGGWKAYLKRLEYEQVRLQKEKEAEHARQIEAHRATLKSVDIANRSLKVSRVTAIVTVGISLAALAVSIYPLTKSNNELDELRAKVNSLDSLIKAQRKKIVASPQSLTSAPK